MTNYAAALAAQFHLKEQQTAKLIELIDAGNTIPFIARYRKEEHGSLDDQTIRTVYERLQYLRNLDTRKAEVRELIEGTGNLTPEIEKALQMRQRWQRSTIFTARSAQAQNACRHGERARLRADSQRKFWRRKRVLTDEARRGLRQRRKGC